MRSYCEDNLGSCYMQQFGSAIQSVTLEEGEKFYLEEAIKNCIDRCNRYFPTELAACISNAECYSIRLPLKMTFEELKKYIKEIGPAYCNEVMGVADCGSKPGTSSTDPIVDSDIFKKWEDAGGQCPKGYKASICSTGCRSEASSSNVFDTGRCY